MTKKILSPAIPYITVSVGLFVFHNAWVAILSYHVGMLIMLFLARPGITVKQFVKSNNYPIPALTAVVGAGGGALLYFLWPFLLIPSDISAYTQSIGLVGRAWPLFLVYYVLVNPVLEEYYWRGYLGSQTRQVTFNDWLFGGYHVIVLAGKMGIVWLIVAFLLLSCGGWFWRQMNRLSQGLLPSVVSHVAADITVMLTIYHALG
ncbi:MAG: CPBP family glutamic-type intramembrane protease [Chloroflexota bacterium]